MSAKIRIKRTTTSGRPETLENAELAFIEGSQILVYGLGTGGQSGSATSLIDIGGAGAFLGLSNTLVQTAGGDYTFSGKVTLTGEANIGAATASSPAAGDQTFRVATTGWVQSEINLAINGDALDAFAPLNSPQFTGEPLAPTAANGTNTNQIATTAFVNAAVASLVDAAPETLNTLGELSDAINGDANFAASIAQSLGGKMAKDANLSDVQNVSAARTNLELGSLSLQDANSVQITGGTLDNVTIDGGTYP